MTNEYVADTVEVIRNIEGFELLPYAVRLLSRGEPVPLDALASASGSPAADVRAALARQVSAEWDDEGRLVGFGLTLRPTPHHITVAGRQLFAWCAEDTLMIPVVLGLGALVESVCPRTRQPIRVAVAPRSIERVEPPEAVVSAVRPQGKLSDVRSMSCQHGYFFSSRAAAAGWAAEHPGGMLCSVPEAFRLNHEIISRLGWACASSGG